MNERFQNALRGEPQKIPPVWMMRQAGRYHRHYQSLKEKYTFVQLCKQPELAAETALGPIQDFDFDAAILFSDILFPLEALGMGLEYSPGPVLDRRLETEADLQSLRPHADAIGHMQFQLEAVRLTRARLPNDKSLIGFIGGAWTLFTYASAGDHGGHLIGAKTRQKLAHMFYERLIPLLVGNVELQLQGGAEVVMVFDTAAGELAPDLFADLALPLVRELTHIFPGKIGYYARATTQDHLRYVRSIQGLAGFGVDHRYEMARLLQNNNGTGSNSDARNSPGERGNAGFVQGNFDQALLFLNEDDFVPALERYLRPLQILSPTERAGWICGLGHGVLPRTPERNVRRFVEKVREVFA
ncbi:MAG: uroporphyrinogen decarboxylase [Leptospiraceae bacterium]|nr:uroporphyrinogen decarboxylase [Leptospiraceae bacterium]